MISEKSAGAIVFLKEEDKILYLVLDYGKHWDFPKGHVEQGESEEETVIRETKEETGIDDLEFIKGFKETIKYFYRRDRTMFSKTVVFYLTETKTKDVKLSHEHSGFDWLQFEDANKKVTFKNAKDVLKKANDFLTGNVGLGKFLK